MNNSNYQDYMQHMLTTWRSPIDRTINQIVPSTPPVAIHLMPEGKASFHAFTSGMSTFPLKCPKTGEQEFAELLVHLPKDWPIEKIFESDEFYWPFRWMFTVARQAHEEDDWFKGPCRVIDNGEPLGPNTEMTCMLLLTGEEKGNRLETQDGQSISIYTMSCIYKEEADYLEQYGVMDFLLTMGRELIPATMLNPTRRNVFQNS